MDIEDFLKNQKLPKKYYDSNFDIVGKYIKEAKTFIEGLKKVDHVKVDSEEKQEQLKGAIKQVIPNIESNICKILKVFHYYEKANPKRAQEEFDDVMELLNPEMFVSTIDDWNEVDTSEGKKWIPFRTTCGRQFYRVRGVDGRSKKIEDNPDELFHLPLNKKNLINNERFSLAGYPGLYLSSVLPLAWQESGYPQKYYYSEYQYLKMSEINRSYEEELKFLALYSPQEIYEWGIAQKHKDFALWEKVVCRCLMMYPLVMACSFVNHSGKGPYKQEYIIPQMLMQWVQRNIDIVQGISYFTCVDIHMMSRQYCAYNVVIPALQPYDDKKYSQKLRDEFTWTRPAYFEVPLLDCDANKEDRRIIYNYINRISNFYRYMLPNRIRDYINEIERVCVCVYHLMKSGNNMDIQLLIHMLDLIDASINSIKEENVEEILKIKDDDQKWLSDAEYQELIDEIRSVVEKFLDTDISHNSIATIIDKYVRITWNDYHTETEINITYREDENIDGLKKWLHNNHLIYSEHILTDEDAIKLNKEISDIKTPLVRRYNSVNIYNQDSPEYLDYVKEGFDIKEDGLELVGDVR